MMSGGEGERRRELELLPPRAFDAEESGGGTMAGGVELEPSNDDEDDDDDDDPGIISDR